MKLYIMICTGNICRSPMGEAILKKKISDSGMEDEYKVVSRGVAATNGDPVSDNSKIAMEEVGIDISSHRAKIINEKEMADAEMIFVMTDRHKRFFESFFPQFAEKIKVLNVPDPYGLDLDAYRRCRDAMIEYFDEFEL